MKFKEDNLQMAVAKYLDAIGILWCHVPNERKTSHQAGRRLKLKGVKSGVPDCLIFEPNKKYNGLAIELKFETKRGFSQKTGKPLKPIRPKPTDNQLKWLCNLSSKSWYTCVCYSVDEVIKIINDYKLNKL